MRRLLAIALVVAALIPRGIYAASPIDNLPAIGSGASSYPLIDPNIPGQTENLWITQAGVDYKIDPLKLGSPYVSATAPSVPFLYQLWWNTATTPATLEFYNGSSWTIIGGAGGIPSVNTNTDLRAQSPGSQSFIIRQDFAAGAGAPPLMFSWQSACPGTPDNLGYLVSPNAASAGCWQAMYAPPGMDVREFGATCNGSADSSGALNAAQSAAAVIVGGHFFLPVGQTCAIANKITFTANGVGMDCSGGASFGSTSSEQCALKWIGASGGTMVDLPQTSNGRGVGITNNSVRNIYFDGNSGLAKTAIHITAQQGRMDNLVFRGFNSGYIVDFDPYSTTGLHINVQGWLSQNLYFDNAIGTSGAIRLGCTSDSGVVYCSSYNTFIDTEIHVNGTNPGVLYDGGSNNIFVMGRVYTPVGTPSFDLSIHSDVNGTQIAFGNVINTVWMQRAAIARGTDSFATCTPFSGTGNSPNTSCTYNNTIIVDSLPNGGQLPTKETGAQLTVTDTYGRAYGWQFVGDTQMAGQMVVNNQAAWGQCMTDMLANGPSTGTYACTTGTNAITSWDFGPNQDRWYWYGNGSAGSRNLTLTHPLGSGGVLIEGLKTTDAINGQAAVSTSTLTKTNDTTNAVIPGFQVALSAGATYACKAFLHGSSGAAGGLKVGAFAPGGTLTATAFRLTAISLNGTTVARNDTSTTLGSFFVSANFAYTDMNIDFSITVGNAGNLSFNAAQNTSDATPTTVAAGSTFNCTRTK